MTFDDYAKFVSTYDLDYTAKFTGVPKNRLEALAELYADPKIKVMSFWTMGFNQHTRGVWCNNLVYNLHLLTGKISTPGNSPFSLTGQPSACGTAREVGTFAHRLPADMVVTNPKHRAEAEHVWKLPEGTIPGIPGLSRRAAEPHAEGRQAQRLLGDGEQQHAGGGQPDAGRLSRATAIPDNFIVVSDVYPTVTALAADLILPAAMWVEKEGAYGNAERRTHFWHQLVTAAGRGALRSVAARWNFRSGSRWKRYGRPSCSPRRPRTAARRCTKCCSATARSTSFRLRKWKPATTTTKRKCLRLLCAEGPVRRVCAFRSRPWPRPRAVRHLPSGSRPALAGRERQGNAVALPRGRRPLRETRNGLPVLRLPRREGGDLCAALRAAAGSSRQGLSRSGFRPAACWSIGTRAP